MPRAKKDGRRINYFIERDVFEEFELFATTQRYPMTTAIEILLDSGLEKEAEIRGFKSKKEWIDHMQKTKDR